MINPPTRFSRLLEFDDQTAQQPDEEPDKRYSSQQLPTLSGSTGAVFIAEHGFRIDFAQATRKSKPEVAKFGLDPDYKLAVTPVLR